MINRFFRILFCFSVLASNSLLYAEEKDQDPAVHIRKTFNALEKLFAATTNEAPEEKESTLLVRFKETTPNALDCFSASPAHRLDPCTELTLSFNTINPFRLKALESYEEEITLLKISYDQVIEPLLRREDLVSQWITPLWKEYDSSRMRIFSKYQEIQAAYIKSDKLIPHLDSPNQEAGWTVIFKLHRFLNQQMRRLKGRVQSSLSSSLSTMHFKLIKEENRKKGTID